MAEYYRNGWYTPLTKKIDKNAKDIKDLDDAVEALESEVPDPPEVDGIYSLKASVESGEGDVEWIEDENELPDTPSVDGTYSLKVDVESGEGSPEWVEDENELPTLPVANGEYALKVTMSSGTATKEWVEFPMHNYSTDEKIVGTWIDGSIIYEKTIVGLNFRTVSNAWVDTEIPFSNISQVITCIGGQTDSSMFNLGFAKVVDGTLRIWTTNDADYEFNKINIQYTKTPSV